MNLERGPLRLTIPDELEAAAVEVRSRIRAGFPLWLRAVIHSDVLAITLGRRIYLGASLAACGEAEIARIVRHELVHARQVDRHGVIPFLYFYLREYFGLRLSGLGHGDAYLALSFEVEARAGERA